jgi:hypothetical protein
MKLVKVKSGTYGYLPEGSTRRVAKTISDPPFYETDIKAARFVKQGILEYVENAALAAAATRTETSPPPSGNSTSGDDTKPYNASTKFNELKRIAAEVLGIKIETFGMKKAELLALMDARWAEMTASVDDDEDEDDNDEDDNEDGDENDDSEDDIPPPAFGALDPKD